MPETGYLAVFLVGLLGGVHCVGMCGGIVSALSLPGGAGGKPAWPVHLAYNLGRILSYGLAGAVLGGLGQFGVALGTTLPLQIALYVLANLLLIALGLYLVGYTRVLSGVERGGHYLWRRVQPYTQRFLPVRGVAQALPLGMLWGWLPCGMVYSVLALALASGSTQRGAMLLLAFGLGTLPNMLLAGLLLTRFRQVMQTRALRLLAGMLVLGFGVHGLLGASRLGRQLWVGASAI